MPSDFDIIAEKFNFCLLPFTFYLKTAFTFGVLIGKIAVCSNRQFIKKIGQVIKRC